MAVVTMRQLLEAGVHFGHQTRRWNPKMKRFILTERNGIYIIDLQQTLADIDIAYDFVKQTVAHGGSVLFVGTKKQAQEAIQEQAARVGMPYVNHRWLGGMLTNFQTVSKRLQRMKELEQVDFDDVAASGRTKKELLMMRREKDKLTRTLGGIRDMAKLPSAVWIVDPKKEHLAVAEATKLNIPIVAILDTNADPDEVQYRIPGNDDAIRGVQLLTRVIADGVAEGLLARSTAAAAKKTGDDADAKGDATAAEPLAEWERELLEGQEGGAQASAEKADTPAPEAAAVKADEPVAEAIADTADDTPEAADAAVVAVAESKEAPEVVADEAEASVEAEKVEEAAEKAEKPAAKAAKPAKAAAEKAEEAVDMPAEDDAEKAELAETETFGGVEKAASSDEPAEGDAEVIEEDVEEEADKAAAKKSDKA